MKENLENNKSTQSVEENKATQKHDNQKKLKLRRILKKIILFITSIKKWIIRKKKYITIAILSLVITIIGLFLTCGLHIFGKVKLAPCEYEKIADAVVQKLQEKEGMYLALPLIGEEMREELGEYLGKAHKYISIAEEAMLKEDYKIAEEQYSLAIEILKIPSLLFNRGTMRSYQEDLDGAILDYDRVLELDSDFIGAYMNRGTSYYAKGEFRKALDDFSEVVNRDPYFDNLIYFNRSGVYNELAQYNSTYYDSAFADCYKGIELMPYFAGGYNTLGVLKHETGDYKGAITAYNIAISFDSIDVMLFFNRGLAKTKDGDLEGAIKDYIKVIELDPEYAINVFNNSDFGYTLALHQVSISKYKEGNYSESLRLINKAIEIANLYHPLYSFKAIIQFEQQLYDSMIVNLTKALENIPDSIPHEFEDLVSFKADSANILFLRGVAKAALGFYDSSIIDINKSISIDSTNPEVYSGRAAVYYKMGKTKEAEADRKRAKELGYIESSIDPKFIEL